MVVLISCRVAVQNATLRQQFSELRQRYSRAKQAIKVAQERLDDNNRRKEELLRQQQKNNDEAIIAESSQFSFHLLNFLCTIFEYYLFIEIKITINLEVSLMVYR